MHVGLRVGVIPAAGIIAFFYETLFTDIDFEQRVPKKAEA